MAPKIERLSKQDREIIQKATKILKATDWEKVHDKDVARLNGWANELTGIGTKLDKRTGGKVSYTPMEEGECEQLYAGDKMARRLCEILPNEATREWITLKGFDTKTLNAITRELEQMSVRDRVRLGMIYANVYGGAGSFMNVIEEGAGPYNDLTKPLDLSKAIKLQSMWTFGRFELEVLAADVEYNLDDPNFGKPRLYMLVPRNRTDQSIMMQRKVIKFHHTRILRFMGAQLPRRIEISNRYWGDSILGPFVDILRDHKIGVGSLAHILQDFRTAVVKIKGLAGMIGAGQEGKIKQRINLMDVSKSVLGALLMDAENEDYDYKGGSLEGVDKIVQALKLDLTSTTDVPHTILFNESPSGLGATGNSELRHWYDYVHSQQESYLRPILNRFFEVYFACKQNAARGSAPEGWHYVFNSLWQQTDQEVADTRLKVAQADQIYMQEGVLHENEVRHSRFGGDEWTQETQIDKDLSASDIGGEPGEPDEFGNPTQGKPGVEPTFNKKTEDGKTPKKDAEIQQPSNQITDPTPNPGDGAPGTNESPESQAIAMASQSSGPAALTATRDANTGRDKDETYVAKLYNSFVQDGMRYYRLNGDAMVLQTIIVSKEIADTVAKARAIAKEIGKTSNVDETSTSFRFRQRDPADFDRKTFRSKNPKAGITLTFGKLK